MVGKALVTIVAGATNSRSVKSVRSVSNNFEYVDNQFKAVWIANKDGLHNAYELSEDKVFSPVWNQKLDILYVCVGPSSHAKERVDIVAIMGASRVNHTRSIKSLTDRHNNAFPSSNPDGDKLVYRSTGKDGYKNLYIMDNAKEGSLGAEGVEPRSLTEGKWTDTHCQWSPNGEWIVFSSTRDKPDSGAPESDQGLDPGYFAVYLVKMFW
ncbi:uncharacterized protein LOC113326205 [Papaver somniferum]|uniref:uncharacterized protein LOC113326205 n=1 Tax=Papaver somniferum TaxID=3469 RepID=UPI000E6F9943|nr:uncharacterized protein LOC113326205 [Papaver somniferum]